MTPMSNPPQDVPVAPPGDPASLTLAVDRYAQTQAAIERAADQLLAAVFEGEGLAMTALGQTAGKTQVALSAAGARYQGTTSALRDYVVDLDAFHRVAGAAIDRERDALGVLEWAEQATDAAADRLRRASLNPDAAFELDRAHADFLAARLDRDAARDAVHVSRSEYGRANGQLDDAANRAIARIVASFEGTNDGLLDHVERVLSGSGQLLTELGRRAREFLADVLAVVVAAVQWYLKAVVVTLVLIALAVALVMAAALVLAVVVAVLAVVIGALLWLLAAVRAGAAMYGLTEVLGIAGLAQIRLVMAAASAVCPPLAILLVSRLADEAGKPTPAVAPLQPGDAKSPQAAARLDKAVPTNAADVLSWAGLVDQIGGDQRAVVDVAQVTQEDGSVAWVVTLPSTQDWVLLGDQPAPNDFDADLVLLAFPELQTQYERAVLAAMAQAGIPRGDPVLLSGWSLGGIAGGRLVEAGAGGYNYRGLIAAGSPIDHMQFAQDVDVLQVKHTRDVVHRMDLIDGLADTAHRVSVWDGPRSGNVAPLQASPIGAHSNTAYVETLRANLLVDDTASRMFSDFYAVDDPATKAVPQVEHTQYAFSE